MATSACQPFTHPQNLHATPSPSREAHTPQECPCLKGWLGGVLSLLIKSLTGNLLPTHSSLSPVISRNRESAGQLGRRCCGCGEIARFASLPPHLPPTLHVSLWGTRLRGSRARKLEAGPGVSHLLFPFPQISSSSPHLPQRPGFRASPLP